MIIAIEGPHGAGKSTLFDNIKLRESMLIGLRPSIHWIQFKKRDWNSGLFSCKPLVIELFSMMYDSEKDLIISDRIWPITSSVYDHLDGKVTPPELLEPSWWPHVRIIYLPSGDGKIEEEAAYALRIWKLKEGGVPCLMLPRLTKAERALHAIKGIREWCT